MSFCWYQIGIRSNPLATNRLLNPPDSCNLEIFYVRVPAGTRILDAIQRLDPTIQPSQIMMIQLVSNCPGCRENQPNQEAHMVPGGCLESPDKM